jgi:hypothetical protein
MERSPGLLDNSCSVSLRSRPEEPRDRISFDEKSTASLTCHKFEMVMKKLSLERRRSRASSRFRVKIDVVVRHCRSCFWLRIRAARTLPRGDFGSISLLFAEFVTGVPGAVAFERLYSMRPETASGIWPIVPAGRAVPQDFKARKVVPWAGGGE